MKIKYYLDHGGIRNVNTKVEEGMEDNLFEAIAGLALLSSAVIIYWIFINVI
jgi:hypothetical protein